MMLVTMLMMLLMVLIMVFSESKTVEFVVSFISELIEIGQKMLSDLISDVKIFSLVFLNS